ncbi:MAG: NlpC/P60 family protein [Scandinavium sp.]|uniref:NlpC/P60 family protein n=1 Tax=Scandinavium sp. TaxID=2830653 RepID=UPI003F3A19A6
MSFSTTLTSAVLIFILAFAASSVHALNLPTKMTTLNQSTAGQVSSRQGSGLKTALLRQYAQWQGTPYNLGGNTRRGIDCSALVQKIFSQHIALPRTTHQQKAKSMKVSKHELRVGDLVFFKSSPRVPHVGVYIGDKQFIHASQKVGVTISRLDNPYWAPRYETARRIVH